MPGGDLPTDETVALAIDDLADVGDPYRVLDEDGSVVDGAVVPELADDELLAMYEEMRLARRFDARAMRLQREGRMGTYPPLEGQEAAQIGSVHALSDADVVIPSFREHGALMARGHPPELVMRYWMGDSRGATPPEDVNAFVPGIPIGTHLLHAVGAAWAGDYRGEDRATLCYFGDGATSEGDVHEAWNVAGVFDLPVVFVCNNNQWAISTPTERQTAAETFAVKARAYGFPGVRVDGMDPLAVYAVTRAALARARDDDGDAPRPTLIEAVQYRFGPHTTSDDPTRYRDEAEVERWRERDPLPRVAAFLRDRGLLDDAAEAAIDDRVASRLDDAVAAAEAAQPPDPADLFAFVYGAPPSALEAQREALADALARHPDRGPDG